MQLIATTWVEPVIVGAILLIAAGWLTYRAVRVWRDKAACSCDAHSKGCPASRMMTAIDARLKRDETK